MALTPVPAINPGLGNVPDPSDSEAVFDADAFDFTTRLPGFGDDVKAIGDATYLNAQWAEAKAGEAETSASDASASETNAGDSATAAAGSAAAANTSAINALASEVAASKLNLGDKTSDPTVDNQGGVLRAGATYYNTTIGKWRVWSGSAWEDGLSAVAGVSSLNGLTGPLSGFLTEDGVTMAGPINEAPIVTIASASTVDIGAADANTINITGTTTVTSLGAVATGTTRLLVFAGALTLTHNATSLILIGSANIVTAAGDAAQFISLGGGNWKCAYYQRFSGITVAPSTPDGVYLRKLVTQSATTLTIPAGCYKVRAYAGGKGGDGRIGSSPTGAGSGGGFAFGDIAVVPGDVLNLSIIAGVSKVIKSAVDLLTANPGIAGSNTADVAGGTASIHASVTNGGAYSGGAGKYSATVYPGGGSCGSPLGNGFNAGPAASDVGGAGIGGSSGGRNGGGSGGGGASAGGSGGAGGAATSTKPGAGRSITFSDPLLSGCIGSGMSATVQVVIPALPGAGGAGTTIAGSVACSGGFGGGGGASGGSAGYGGVGGELGGGGGGASDGYGGSSLACGGGGAGGAAGGTGGPATIWIFY